MSTTIDSTRFGRIEVAPDSAIEFPNGLIGFDSRTFTLVARDAEDAFLWLQSLDDPELALPLTDPRRFFAGFQLALGEGEVERLGLTDDEDAFAVYVTVRASERPEDCTANLRAPIVIVDGRGHQVINHAEDAELRAPLFGELVAEGQAA